MKHIAFLKKVLILVLLFVICDFFVFSLLVNGLNKYYGINDSPEILINGSSSAMSGFNRTDLGKITGLRVANYSHEGVTVDEQYVMLDYFFRINEEDVQTVIYEVSPIIFSDIETAENVYTILYPYMNDKLVDTYIRGSAGARDYYINKIIKTKRFDARLTRLVLMGYLSQYDNLKATTLDTNNLESVKAQKGTLMVTMDTSKIKVFENTMELIKSNSAKVVLVMMPFYYIKLQTFDSIGYQAICNYFDSYCRSKENMRFIDLNQDNLVRNPDYFSDLTHFNIYGQKQITNIIGKYLTDF